MKSISVLDCTLRDGGYCNSWRFGRDNIGKIINGLVHAGIDVVECGFVTDKVSFDPDTTKFPSVQSVSDILPADRGSTRFVAMINYGEYDPESIPVRDGSSIDGIRIAFHKKDLDSAIEYCSIVKSKGYDTYVQAMVSMAYTDAEFIDLISRVNDVMPYAFYIVDSFGMMKRKDLARFFSLIEHNLDKSIKVGFHSHNNLQLAYSNALAFLDMRSGRDVIVDTSVYGMGRGAGNLNTELFVDHLDDDFDAQYSLSPILVIMDEVINGFYQKSPWGYSLPNYLSATHSTHPNYAGYLSDKNTLTIEAMDNIFACMDPDKRTEFDKEYIESLYLKCMSAGRESERHYSEFTDRICGKNVLLIAPGRSSYEECGKVREYSEKQDVITISVNFIYGICETDYAFVSNIRRYREISVADRARCIITSNIHDNDAYLQIRYSDLLNDDEAVRDNAGLMAIKMLKRCGANKVVLAGFDGYSHDALENYADGFKAFMTRKAVIDATNNGLSKVLRMYSKDIEIEFLTPPRHYNV